MKNDFEVRNCFYNYRKFIVKRKVVLYYMSYKIHDFEGELEMNGKRKNGRKILMTLLMAVLLVTGMAVSVPAASRLTIRHGKVYQDNKPVVNKIVGSKAKGYYYVDKTGRKVNTREIRQAVDFVMRNSKAGDSRAKRLRACYRALLNYPYFGMTSSAPTAKNLPSYARYMFSCQRGDCYYYASTMAYIARVLGYESRVAVGGVTARGPYAALSLHGWCEVKYGKTWRMLDCSMQRAHMDRNLCLVTRKQYPFRLRCDKVYRMTVKNAKVKWF